LCKILRAMATQQDYEDQQIRNAEYEEWRERWARFDVRCCEAGTKCQATLAEIETQHEYQLEFWDGN